MISNLSVQDNKTVMENLCFFDWIIKKSSTDSK